MPSKYFGKKMPAIPHLARGAGGVMGEVADLRSDIEEAFQEMEADASSPTPPTSPSVGQVFYDQTLNVLMVWDGSVWMPTNRAPVYSNATRPAASGFPAGSMIFNSDDNAPNFSDGAAWRDASGSLT